MCLGHIRSFGEQFFKRSESSDGFSFTVINLQGTFIFANVSCDVISIYVDLLTCLITPVYGDGCGNVVAKVTISACVTTSCFGLMS